MQSLFDRSLTRLTFTIVGTVALLSCFAILQTNAFNDDRGVQKWSPYWLSSSRFSEPVSYYGGMSRAHGFPKRLGDASSLYGSDQIYKWSPVYFSDPGMFSRSGYGRYKTKNLNVISSDGFDSDK